jgi:hypothetical protein
MGVPMFFMLFWGLVIAFLGSGLLVSGLGWWLGRKRKAPVLTWVCGVFFCGFSAVVLTWTVLAGVSEWRSSQPDLVFADVFHEKPPQGVALLHGESGSFIDSAGVSLAFRADRATFDRLRPDGLERETLDRYRHFLRTRPTWWREPTETTEIWISDLSPIEGRQGPNYSSETTFMTWDTDGLVQYDWEGMN